jgi:GntR family transcriptional regulator, arabinose operon transcriptional repressor
MAKPKYQEIIEEVSRDILSGRFKPGQKLASEAGFVKKYATSRITVGRALRELQQMGLVQRVAGSGSYVRNETSLPGNSLLFGLLIPDLGETEIFDPICHGIASAPETADHGLLWGHTDARQAGKEEQCWKLCEQFIARKVSGVFFAPLEFEPAAEKANLKVLSALKEAGIPVVLLDRRPSSLAERNRADLAGLNNRQAGYVATEHLIQLGCKRIGFMAYQGAASTISGRLAGYAEALRVHGLPELVNAVTGNLSGGEPLSAPAMEEVEAFVCLNDRVAGQLMQAFLSRGIRIPEDIRLVGIDDVAYAGLLPTPLTTIHQPCDEIGQAAMRLMLDRIERPQMTAREVLLDGKLVVRKSCGSDLMG